MKYRNSTQIMGDLLIELEYDHNGIGITKLCSKTNMTYSRTKKLLKNLSSAGIINEIVVEGKDTYIITERGRVLLDEYKKYNEYNAKGKLITPGLIDCHTHLVFGGNRSTEFNMRLNGKSYQEIAKAGGGIASTMKATREASFDDLLSSSLVRLDDMIRNGVTTVEIKSGYGLDIETECLMLRVAKRLESLRPIRIKTSFLGSHGRSSILSA